MIVLGASFCRVKFRQISFKVVRVGLFEALPSAVSGDAGEAGMHRMDVLPGPPYTFEASTIGVDVVLKRVGKGLVVHKEDTCCGLLGFALPPGGFLFGRQFVLIPLLAAGRTVGHQIFHPPRVLFRHHLAGLVATAVEVDGTDMDFPLAIGVPDGRHTLGDATGRPLGDMLQVLWLKDAGHRLSPLPGSASHRGKVSRHRQASSPDSCYATKEL